MLRLFTCYLFADKGIIIGDNDLEFFDLLEAMLKVTVR